MQTTQLGFLAGFAILLWTLPVAYAVSPVAATAMVPCDGSTLVIAGSGLEGPIGCEGFVACPADAPAPCHWNVKADIWGVGLVNAFAESGPEFNRCAMLPTTIACGAHIHFQHDPGTVRAWTCGADSTTTAALVELSCFTIFDGIR